MVTDRRKLGDVGEQMAVERLVASGLQIVARNVRTASGEIDIVAKDGVEFVFVEVRTRRGTFGEAAESVTSAKLARMWQCAEEYCALEGHDLANVRVDVVTIDLGPGGRGPTTIAHLKAVELPT